MSDEKSELNHLRVELKKLKDAQNRFYAMDDTQPVPLQGAKEIEEIETRIEQLQVEQAIARTRKAQRLDSIGRHSILALGCLSLIGLAYLFKGSTLASIPLLGIVVLLVLWPVFEKFRLLSRINAEFQPSKINLVAEASNTDEYLRIQSEIAKTRARVELAKVQGELKSAEMRKYELASGSENAKAEENRGPFHLSAGRPEGSGEETDPEHHSQQA